ncbi:hypothetical protein LC085_11905 [Bacillus tianshenii]|uniref:hypothetical protein n=1 Tax=Sutcliffiella tianshenii TaxID=1463404 RepID=UPI001CD58125|nr:hypothetical protein [Bacillus tianshenii]MCA1320616.1 hypothetical protein [Bacillus tianshenii]
MKKYLILVAVVLAIELGILFGISFFFDFNLLSTMFFGSVSFVLLAFILGSTGDVFSKNSQVAVFDSLAGSYQPKHEKMTLRVGPVMVGSILCVLVYFGMSFFMG